MAEAEALEAEASIASDAAVAGDLEAHKLHEQAASEQRAYVICYPPPPSLRPPCMKCGSPTHSFIDRDLP